MINNTTTKLIHILFLNIFKDFPGLDSLAKYDVNVTESGGVRIRAKKSLVKKGNRTKSMCTKTDNPTVVIVGGGGAAQSCAETLRSREEPWKGRIIMITKENCLPYDRPKLSKVRYFNMA